MPLETVERLNTQRTKILMGEIKQYRQPKKKISRKHLIIGLISIATTFTLIVKTPIGRAIEEVLGISQDSRCSNSRIFWCSNKTRIAECTK